jgi:hypothetical protein
MPDTNGPEPKTGLRLVMARFIAAMQLRNVHLFNLNKSVVALRDKLFGPPKPEELSARAADLPDPRDPTKLFVHALRSDTFERMVGTLDARQWMVSIVTSSSPRTCL